MENVQDITTWRELLARLIKNPREKERLASAIGMKSITLTRWIAGISSPRARNINNLLHTLPVEQARLFRKLASDEFPELIDLEIEASQVPEDIPVAFYMQILQIHAWLRLPMGRQTLQDLLLQQASAHLDPQQHGMFISLVVCTRPLEGCLVRSLREIGGIGTPPWKHYLEQKLILLGAESLVGHALTRFRSLVVSNRDENTRFPVHWTEYEQSAVAVPIARYGQLCGCLLAASAVPDYFQENNLRVRLLEKYASLATLLFDAGDFYAPEAIHLGFMPPFEMQLPYFQDFNRFLQQQFRLAQIRGIHYTLEQARHQVWREIEEKFIQDSIEGKLVMYREEENV
jgi:transcriptional regulator with XRE-family HTH domain